VIRLLKAARSVQTFCRARGWRFCFIGGIALQRWGEPRMTRDVDVSLLAGFGREQEFIRPLLHRFKPRLRDAEEFALQHRVLLLQTREGIGVDVAFAALPFEESMIGRATPFAFQPHIKLLTCSAEDLVVLKAFADRPQDWIDVENVLTRQGSRLDWKQLMRELRPLAELKDQPDILQRIGRLRRGRPA